jgi:ADP-ribose pyrophosphatase
MPEKPIKRYARKNIFQGYCFNVVRDEVLWPNQNRIKRDLLVHPGITVIIPRLDRNRIVLIRQYRYGAGQTLWEIPAGTIDGKESPLACARREIQEEIGYKAKTWKKIISFYPCPGFSTEIIHAFEASNLTKTATALENDEIIEAHVFTHAEVQKMIKAKKIIDAKSLVPLFYFFQGRF